MLVKEIMTRDVITVTQKTTLKELAKVINSNRINGAPVVDEIDGTLIGVITMTDLLRMLKHICFWDEIGARDNSQAGVLGVDIKDALLKEKDKAVVGAKMTKVVHTVEEDDSVDEVLAMMCRYNIHTIPVVKNHKVVGIIGATDIVNYCI
ncbi:MAG: CBS domain-containing protein [Candidatus Omnitrophica bacterium]|jgi:CBS domain-containing protein|nr:CBS domain-containing protein [Candidatus Omnitrophota bacterium]